MLKIREWCLHPDTLQIKLKIFKTKLWIDAHTCRIYKYHNLWIVVTFREERKEGEGINKSLNSTVSLKTQIRYTVTSDQSGYGYTHVPLWIFETLQFDKLHF